MTGTKSVVRFFEPAASGILVFYFFIRELMLHSGRVCYKMSLISRNADKMHHVKGGIISERE